MNKEYSTILVLCIALIILNLLTKNILFLYIAAGIGLLCIISPLVAKNIHWSWMKLSLLLGAVSSFVLLAIIFFVILTPLSLFAKLVGKKFLLLKRSETSYFQQRDFLYNKESIENTW